MKNKILKISFFGSSLVSAYWNGAATYYRGLLEALFLKYGHNIKFYEPDAFERQQHRDLENVLYAKSIIYKAEIDSVYEAIQDSLDSDIIIKASGVGVFDELLETEIISHQNNHRKILFLDVDAPATLDRIEKNTSDPFINIIPKLDAVLTYGGGDLVVQKYKSFKAKHCIPIYNALDPKSHYPVSPLHELKADLGFLGNRMPDREQRTDEYFFNPARKLTNRQFILGGSGWDSKSAIPSNVKYVGHVYTNQHNAFNSSMLAVLNINRNSMASYGFSPPTRIFEAAGAGACIITDNWAGIEKFLTPGEECFAAKNSEEVAAILEQLTIEKSKMIGKNAMKRILNEHTYYHRADELQNIFTMLFD